MVDREKMFLCTAFLCLLLTLSAVTSINGLKTEKKCETLKLMLAFLNEASNYTHRHITLIIHATNLNENGLIFRTLDVITLLSANCKICIQD